MALTVVVRSLQGEYELQDLSATMEIPALKQYLYNLDSCSLPIPAPEKQKLVYKGKVLQNGSLADAGLCNGDKLVLLAPKEHVPSPVVDTTPTPTSSVIRAAILSEAQRRGVGVEAEAGDGRSGQAAHLAQEATMDPRLLSLLEALEGRLTSMRSPLTPAEGDGGSGSSSTSSRRRGGEGSHSSTRGHSSPPSPSPLRAPTPPPLLVSQLASMGFNGPRVARALALSGNSLEGALEWLMEHGEDAGADEPLSQEEIRRAQRHAGASSSHAARRSPPNIAEIVRQLTDMGFVRAAAETAARRFRSVEGAMEWLLEAGDVTAAETETAEAAVNESESTEVAMNGIESAEGVVAAVAAMVAAAIEEARAEEVEDGPDRVGEGEDLPEAPAEASESMDDEFPGA